MNIRATFEANEFAVCEPELNRIPIVQECDARMMNKEQMLVT